MPVLNFRYVGTGPDGKAVPAHHLLRRSLLRVQVVIGWRDAAVATLSRKGLAAPQPIVGQAIIDTGATFTSIDESAAIALGLQPTGVRRISAAGGPIEKPTFAFKLTLQTIFLETSEGIGCDLKDQGIIALIGMDLLCSGILIVNGLDGSFSFSI